MCGQTGFGATPGAAQPGMFGGAAPPATAAGALAPQLQGRDRIAQTLMPQMQQMPQTPQMPQTTQMPPTQQPQMPLAQQLQMQRRAQMQRGMPSMGTPDDFVSRTPGPRPFDPTTFMNAFRRR